MDKITERSQFVSNDRNGFRRENFRGSQNYRDQNFRGGYRGSYRNETLEEVAVDLEKDSIQILLEGMIEVVIVDKDQV